MMFGFQVCINKAMVARKLTVMGMTVVTSFSGLATPVLAEVLRQDTGRSPQGGVAEEVSSTCQAHQRLDQPIAIVIQDPSQHPEWSEGVYEPTLAYGDLNEFEDSQIVMLMPEGQEFSDEEMATIEGRGWGRRFLYLMVPSIAQEVIERYLEQNTRSLYRSSSSSSREFRVRSIAREVCLDFT